MAGNRKGSFYSHPSSTIGRHEALSPIDLPAAESLDYQKPPLLLDQFSEFFFEIRIQLHRTAISESRKVRSNPIRNFGESMGVGR